MIEVPAVAVEKIRDNPELILRQGMANGARFTHPELSTLDQRIAEAAARAAARERVVFGMAGQTRAGAGRAARRLRRRFGAARRAAIGGSLCADESLVLPGAD